MIYGSIPGLEYDKTYYVICMGYDSEGMVIRISKQIAITRKFPWILFMLAIIEHKNDNEPSPPQADEGISKDQETLPINSKDEQ